MKKFRYLFLVFLTAIVSGLYLISCGGDGDGDSGDGGSGDGGQGSTTSSIIGTWEMSISGSVEHTVMLCANGIGYFFDEESYDFNIDKFEYIYNKKTEKINIIFWNGQTEVYEIEAIGNDKMIIIRDLDSSKYFCKKINSPYTASQLEKIFQKKYGSDDSDNSDEGGGGIITASSIVGTWLKTSNSDGSEEYTMFCADGTAYIYYEESDGFEVEKFSYIYNAEKGKIIWIEDDSSDTWSDDIKILTDSKLILETHSGNFSNTETYKKTTPTYTAAQLENIYKAQSQKSSN